MTTRYIGSDRLKEGGFLATHKKDFNAHVDGGDYQHKASHIIMNPELSDIRLKDATVQGTLEKLSSIIVGNKSVFSFVLDPLETSPMDNVFTDWRSLYINLPDNGLIDIFVKNNINIPSGEWDLKHRARFVGIDKNVRILLNGKLINVFSFENIKIIKTHYDGSIKWTNDYGTLVLKNASILSEEVNSVISLTDNPDDLGNVSFYIINSLLGVNAVEVGNGRRLDIYAYDGSYIESNAISSISPLVSISASIDAEVHDTQDVPGGTVTISRFGAAKNLPYDNTISGLISTDVQGALDELAQSGGSGSGIKSVDTLDDLRAIASVDLDDNSIYLVQETGHLWKYETNTGANEIDDSNLSVKPNDILQANNGRWRPVISHGKPGIAVGTVTLPTSYLPAGLNIIGAKPIVDGSPADPWHFVGFAVDRGDTAGVKNPYPIFGLNEEGAWVFVEVDMSTMQEKEFYEFRDNEFRIVTHPTDGARKIVVRTKSGATTYTSDDLDLSIEAANTNQDNIQAGNLILKGGDHGDLVGTGGDVLIKPGKSGGSAARLGISALCDEDGVPVVAASKDKLAFFNGTLTEKPTVTGDWGDGTAGKALVESLSNLGLVEDLTNPGPPSASVVAYDNTLSGLTATNAQAAIDELSSMLGAKDAVDLSYDPTTSGLSSNNVQDAIDELSLSLGAKDAVELSYDPTDSGLVSNNVQDAIDELSLKLGAKDAVDLSYDPIGSGLISDNVQGALDELAARQIPEDAIDIAYDNSNSGLVADNIQDAIDEIVDNINNIHIPSYTLNSTDIDLSTISSPYNALIYTVPACLVTRIYEISIILTESIVGLGNVNVRVGSTQGGDDYLIDLVTPIDETSPVGKTVSGLDIATLGSAWIGASKHVAECNENDEIHIQITTNGDITSGKLRVIIRGEIF